MASHKYIFFVRFLAGDQFQLLYDMIGPLAILMVLSLALGGGTTSSFFADIILQCISVLILAYAVVGVRPNALAHLRNVSLSGSGRIATGLVVCLVGIYIIQLIPLPIAWVSTGPLGAEGSSGQMSRLPFATGAALASLLPPIAVFGLALTCGKAERQTAISLLIAVAAVSLVLGFIQVAQGPSSFLRFYQFTNVTEAVGFFANRNHFATLLCVLLVLVLVWLVGRMNQPSTSNAIDGLPLIALAGALACLIAVVTGLMMARSRAGILIAMIIIGSIAIVQWRERRLSMATNSRRSSSTSRLISLGLIAAVVIATQLGLSRLMTRFEADPLEDYRWTLTEKGAALALEHMPFGTGIASFVQSYATSEQSADMLGSFANRAHNDWVEFAIEGGLPAVTIMLCFLVWFGWRFLIGPKEQGLGRLQHISGSLILVVLLLHSLVDYPLRTTALSVTFAFACALLFPPCPEPDQRRPNDVDDQPIREDLAPSEQAIRRWSPAGDDHEWPDAWRK